MNRISGHTLMGFGGLKSTILLDMIPFDETSGLTTCVADVFSGTCESSDTVEIKQKGFVI